MNWGQPTVHEADNHAAGDPEVLRHGDGKGQQTQRGIGCSIRPGVACPATVLVADMGNGSLFLHGWRDGPSAYLIAEDSMSIRHALAAAFGDPKDKPLSGVEAQP